MKPTLVGTVLLAIWILTACGTTEPPATQPTATTATESSNSTHSAQEGDVRIEIQIGDHRIHAVLADSAAARDLIEQLPATMNMRDHGGVEKTGRLASKLSLDGQLSGADPDVGDVGYYAPGNDLVLYYGDQSYYEGIVILGHLEGDAAERIADVNGAVTATVTRADD